MDSKKRRRPSDDDNVGSAQKRVKPNSADDVTEAKEMKFRKHALKNMFQRVQKNDEGYKYYELIKEMVVAVRRKKVTTWSRKNVNYKMYIDWLGRVRVSEHFIRHSVEIALKCDNQHQRNPRYEYQRYVEMMDSCLKDHIGGNKALCSLICELSHNGYIWYNLNYNVQNEKDQNYQHWMRNSYNKAIIYELSYNEVDLMMDNMHYHNQPSTAFAKTFKNLRKDLGSKKLDKMSDEEISEFIATICCALFDFDESFRRIQRWVHDKNGTVEWNSGRRRICYLDDKSPGELEQERETREYYATL